MSTEATFKVSARTVLHLGSELISSDAIAFYELIKNAFDAGSPRIEVDVKIRIRQDVVVLVRELLDGTRGNAKRPDVETATAASVRAWLLEGVVPDAPDVVTWRELINNARSYQDFDKILDDANEIVIADKGHGMSLADLQDVYLTIGTPVRSIQRRRGELLAGRPVLGEKGVGRLSVMRLGDKVVVHTAKKGDGYWNLLEIDWRRFSKDEGDLIENIKLRPIHDHKTAKPLQEQGTTITIRALKTVWTEGLLGKEVSKEVARMMDPFALKAAFPVELRFNGKRVEIERFDKLLFAHANMNFRARFERDAEGLLYMEGEIVVRHKNVDRRERVAVDPQTIKNVVNLGSDDTARDFAEMTIRNLGPFSLTLYWFDRQKIPAIDGIGKSQVVRALVNHWSGGLMLFRDGFRVGRYGGHDDDWLDLDKVALSRSGYKLNRAQIIGKVDVDSINNRHLIDQTNREGLKDNKEKEALRKLLRWVITTYLYAKMVQWEEAANAAEPQKVVDKKIEAAKRSVERAVEAVKRMASDQGDVEQAAEQMTSALADVRDMLPQVGRFVERAAQDRSEIVHLAGIGLLLEIIAHELTRSVGNSLGAIQQARKTATGQLGRSLLVLDAGLRTIEKRLRLLDPLSTSGRQRKEAFDVVEWVRLIADSHTEQMEAAGIELAVRVDEGAKAWPVKMVKGMFVQILENLLNNSVYWLKRVDKRKAGKGFKPKIELLLEPTARTIRVTDNGPGIDEARAGDVFNAFYTERPEGESHGLGLYISREVATYNDATLTLSAEPVVHAGRLNSFVLTLPEA